MDRDRQPGWDEATREAVDTFCAAIHDEAPAAGLARIRGALDAERRRELRRRERGRRIGLLARVAAAVFLLGAGALLLWRWSAPSRAVVVCPHGSPQIQKAERSSGLRAFLENPDKYQRVCQCRPLYSGSQRHPFTSPVPGQD